MSADLGFSDRVYGLGVGMFYLTYVLFEIPGAILVERWSARKWIARIMISWGVVTILTGFVHSATQFYTARFFLGLAEASFYPGVIVYLTHWFSSRDRCRACLPVRRDSDCLFNRLSYRRMASRVSGTRFQEKSDYAIAESTRLREDRIHMPASENSRPSSATNRSTHTCGFTELVALRRFG